MLTCRLPGEDQAGHAPTYGAFTSHLCYGGNLRVPRDSLKDDRVDLISLDLPLNSNASYDVLFKGRAGAEPAAHRGV